jgi:hypothetical protein
MAEILEAAVPPPGVPPPANPSRPPPLRLVGCEVVPQPARAAMEAAARIVRIFMPDTGFKSPPVTIRLGDSVDIWPKFGRFAAGFHSRGAP